MSKGKNIALWVVTVLLALTFLAAGAMKLVGPPEVIENFHKWGLPDWVRIFTGLCEVAAGVLLLVPRTTPVGGVLVVCIMLGAMATHLTHGEAAKIPVPIILLALAVLVTVSRRGNLRRAATA